MTIADAFAILRGGDTAATDYLHDRTAETLRSRFHPIVEDKMRDVGLYKAYRRLAEAYNALPGRRKPALDLDVYLTDRALDGLFTTLAQEERRIREGGAYHRAAAQGLRSRLGQRLRSSVRVVEVRRPRSPRVDTGGIFLGR